ncbi:bifunctional NAD(P)H-hydrate repair enzyme [Spirochaetia bacterium]|nr:bifunctional NAD(P)H-hydrate repair enzyme [Spirochaetia bacterium]
MKHGLISPEAVRPMDAEASAAWGLSSSVLIEAAGRNCAAVLAEKLSGLFSKAEDPKQVPKILVMAGSGNNGADALVMLRALILSGLCTASSSMVIVSCRRDDSLTLEKMGVPVEEWQGFFPEDFSPDIVIDGIAGTGITGALKGKAHAMVLALGKYAEAGKKYLTVSVDIPSGLFTGWQPGMPVVDADFTLGIVPLKTCIYAPAARIHAGRILVVAGIFPQALINAYAEAELLDWPSASAAIPPVRADSYKYSRGLAEIHAGSEGSAGAARIAAAGARSAGAGLVRLLVDKDIYPLLASSAGGTMVAPAKDPSSDTNERFRADALLLGPGWGTGPGRRKTFAWALEKEAAGTPLILDADAIRLAAGTVFHGNAILTPHPGELSVLRNIAREDVLGNPRPILAEAAKELNAVILFKSSVMIIASPDGRLGVVDGMVPALGAGGSGDLLAGFCTALAARTKPFDPYACACAAATLLIECVCRKGLDRKFIDPLELAESAAEIAGEAWLENLHG